MTFYVTFQGTGTPGVDHFATVNAPCEETAIKRVVSAGGKSWSVVSKYRGIVRGKILWRKL